MPEQDWFNSDELINLGDESELRRWSDALGTTARQLIRAVRAVGHRAGDVAVFLDASRSSSVLPIPPNVPAADIKPTPSGRSVLAPTTWRRKA